MRSELMWKYGGGTFFAPADSDPHDNLNKNPTFITSARLQPAFVCFCDFFFGKINQKGSECF